MIALDFASYEALTFDCYGTLIDWETGLLGALDPVLAAHRVSVDDDELLEAYARHEAALESGEYLTYRDVLSGSLNGLGRDYGFEPSCRRSAPHSRSRSETGLPFRTLL